MTSLLVSEVFGPTVQGEGPHTGRRCGFVRLGLCNLNCSWCDTPYTWDWKGEVGPPQDRDALQRMDVAELAEQVNGMGVGVVVLTGGEPLVQQARLPDHLAAWEPAVHVETNATLTPTAAMLGLVAHWTASPKLPSSGVTAERAWNPAALEVLVDAGAAVKVVCCTVADVDATAALADEHHVPPAQVWVMPEGRTAEAITAGLAAIADRAVGYGFNVSGRLHVQAWGDRRGV